MTDFMCSLSAHKKVQKLIKMDLWDLQLAVGFLHVFYLTYFRNTFESPELSNPNNQTPLTL